MAQLRQDYEKFLARNTEVVVVGPEEKRDFQYYWSKKELLFIGLPDPELKVLHRYGQEFSLLKLGRMPAQAIVDKKGVVRFVHNGHSMNDIPRNNEILNLLDQLIIDQFVSS